MTNFEKKPVKPLPLKPLKPVPSDIDIAQEAAKGMKKISELMAEIGLFPDEVEYYGDYKAKVKRQPSQITTENKSAIDSCPVGAISLVDEA